MVMAMMQRIRRMVIVRIIIEEVGGQEFHAFHSDDFDCEDCEYCDDDCAEDGDD